MDNHEEYYEEDPEFKNPQSAEFFQIRREIYNEHVMNMEQNGEFEEDMTLNEEFQIRMEEALENYLSNFTKHGLTQRGTFHFLSSSRLAGKIKLDFINI
jgi:hypothetical protein